MSSLQAAEGPSDGRGDEPRDGPGNEPWEARGDAPLAAPEPPPADGQRQVLVVDDATVIRMYYRQIVEAAGHHVAEAMNGVEALEKALETPFDLAIVDVNMPVMDGLTFVQTLRRDPAIRGLPVLMTSTQAHPRDKLAALRAGVNLYLVKPVPAPDLARHIAALLGDTRDE